MIDYIHEEWQDWARYMTKKPQGWSPKSPAWRLFRDRGSRSKMTEAREPKEALLIFTKEYADVAEIHRVWRTMPEDLSDLMVVFYIRRFSLEKKAYMLGMSVRRMYEAVGNAHFYTVGRLPQKDCAISP